ncbi:MAG: multicopper oxidase family protein [Acidobacteriaceae bacterium]
MRTVHIVFSAFALLSAAPGQRTGQRTVVADPPEVRGPFILTAAYDAESGHNAFFFAGRAVRPTIRTLPGDLINVRYVNNLPVHSSEQCALGPCANGSNLHFHGLHVSPEKPQDDVLTMMSTPGQTLHYRVEIPAYAAPGLYWYHTHPHGESTRQALDGMSGAIVIDGIDRYYPELRQMRERVLVLRERSIENESSESRKELLRVVGVPAERCGTSTEQRPERIFTLNGEMRPQIPINPGERQFWRIVNASPDRYVDLQLGGQQLEVVALDGMPLSYHDQTRRTLKLDHILLAAGGRVEAMVTGPPAGTRSTLSTRCIDTGPDGDPSPSMVIADVVTHVPADSSSHSVPTTAGAPVYQVFPRPQLERLEAAVPDFTVVLTEDKNGFYINGKKFSMDSAPILNVRIGSLHHWKIVNSTRELHPFHIHQVHFLAYGVNGVRQDTPEWLDTVNVPYNGTVDLGMDFTEPIIRGMSVFHCHLLNHEDKGMMAKILFK